MSAKVTTADRIASLEATVLALSARLDAASAAFKIVRDEIKLLRPKAQPESLASRIARSEFDRALEDLRAEAAEAGSTQRVWPRAEILTRAATLAAMEAQREEAGHVG